MARPIWSGHLTFGLVSIPVGLYSAVEADEEVHFRLLHRKDKAPIRYKKFCSKEDVEVPADEIVRGFETSKGRFSVVEGEELQKVQEELGEGEHVIELLQFVEGCTLDPLLFERPYFLGAGKGGDKAYVVLREALRDAGRIGIARVYLRTRPQLAAVLPAGDVLSLDVLRPPSTLRSPQPYVPRKVAATAAERRMAKSLIDQMAGDFDPTAHPDRYRKAVEKLIASKPRFELPGVGEKVPKRKAEVVDLMQALKRSLGEGRARKTRRSRRAA